MLRVHSWTKQRAIPVQKNEWASDYGTDVCVSCRTSRACAGAGAPYVLPCTGVFPIVCVCVIIIYSAVCCVDCWHWIWHLIYALVLVLNHLPTY